MTPPVAPSFPTPAPRSMPRLSLRSLPALAALVAATLAAPIAAPRTARAAAALHLRLVKSEPAAGDTVTSPAVIRLWFSEPATLAVTRVKLANAAGQDVALGAPTSTGKPGDPVAVAVASALAPGRYVISYRTASRDMHPISGDVAFTVR